MERYRSGHNGAVLKTVCLHGRMGSNPILSAWKNHYDSGFFFPKNKLDEIFKIELFFIYNL